MAAVADSSPLIYLAALSDFALLRELFGAVLIPPAVHREVVEQASVREKLDAMRGRGFRLKDGDYRLILEKVGEL